LKKFDRERAKLLIDKKFALHLALALPARKTFNPSRERAKKEKSA